MTRFVVRQHAVEAILFDGTAASALAVITWARAILPDVVVRERIEYSGWDDRDGHLELEIQHTEEQAADGDWVVCADWGGERGFHVVDDAAFRQRYRMDG